VPVVNDLTTATLHSALRGLAARQRTIADNIANIDTPGFLAGKVDFEASLRDAMGSADVADVEPESLRSLAPTGVNGNNVNLDEETLANIDTNLRYQLAIEAVNAKFGLLRTAIGGGR
jgi:flagellar basal-body rod protein FlgB